MKRTGEPSNAELMAQLAANAAEIAALKAEKEALSQRVVKLEEELALARLHRFAPRSEKHIDRIFNEAEQAADEGEVDSEENDVVDLPDTGLPSVESLTGKKRGRRPLPENLPRERVEYDLPDDQKACPCCRGLMHRMGETVTEQLHIEVKAKVLRNVRFKYACRHCDRTGINTPVVTATMPTQPLPGSIATASTLAFALVHKYVDGTPLYRLAQAFERAGVPVSRGALGHWVIGSSEKHLHRIYGALKRHLRAHPLIHGDETTVQVLKEKDREATSTSYMWAYRSGEDSDQPIVLLDYQPGRGQIHPQTFLGDYRGILMSDGYTAWRTLVGATHLVGVDGSQRHRMCQNEFVEVLNRGRPSVEQIIRIGMDTSKSVFQLHGVNASEQPVLRKKLSRREMVKFFEKTPPTTIGLEACGGSHHWARLLSALGHQVKLIAPQLAKPYVKRGKNDAADAEALCEAMSRPTMRFVPVKTADQQAALMLVGVRERLIRNRTQLSNAIRGFAMEFGVVAAKGMCRIEPLLERIATDQSLPELARELFAMHGEEYRELLAEIKTVDEKLMALHRADECSKRLAEIPGVGPIGASLLMMKTPDPRMFKSGRDFAAWIGLTPRDHSTAGKVRLGVITRAGDEMLRSVLVVGATALLKQVRISRSKHVSRWLIDLLHRKKPKLVAVALANKIARIAWKLMVSGEAYRRPQDTPQATSLAA